MITERGGNQKYGALRVVIIGAGLGGLSAALRLKYAGHHVTVLEKNSRPGGKVNMLERDGFRFDTGPTILTLPDEITRLFSDVGRIPDDYLQLERLDPIYRAHFRDGTVFHLGSEAARTLAEIARISPQDAARYAQFMRRTEKIWGAIDSVIFERLFLSWRDVFHPAVIAAGMQVDALRTMYDRVDRMFTDPRIKQLFMFQAIYVGASPRRTPATYTVIPFLEQHQGVWFPRGGMYGIVDAVARVAQEMDLEIRCNTAVSEILVQGGHATGVRLADGSTIKADVVISNADLVHTYGDLVPAAARKRYTDKRLAGYDPSSSAFIMYIAVNREYPRLAHHNIYFGDNYDQEMHDIFEAKVMPGDPSLYICAPARTDRSLAPPGCEGLYVLALAPALGAGSPDWEREKASVMEQMLDRLERDAGLTDIRQHLRWKECFTPQDFESLYNGNRGSIFGLSAITAQTAMFRPPNRSEDVKGLYLVGGSTQPGGGVPIVMISGRLVAELVQSDHRRGVR